MLTNIYKYYPLALIVALSVMSIPMLDAKKKGLKDPLIVTGQWEMVKGVTKLYDTPLGAVYKFTESEFNSLGGRKEKRPKEVYSLQFDIMKAAGTKKLSRRFIVLDLKIRLYPALDSIKNAKLKFTVTRSSKRATTIQTRLDLNGLAPFGDANIGTGFNAPGLSTFKWDHKSLWTIFSGYRYFPGYEVLSYRMIHDTYRNKVYSINANGFKKISPHCEISKLTSLTRCVGIIIQYPQSYLTAKTKSRTILEISPPVVTLTDNKEVISLLKEVEVTAYPYGNFKLKYDDNTIKIANRLNPDAVYATALQLLKGDDLVVGAKLLEKAADREHVFAMYKLAECYWRGIGVKINFRRAIKWVRQAMKYGLADAYSLYSVMSYKSSNKLYLSKKTVDSVTKSKYYPKGRFPLIKYSNQFINNMFYSNARKVDFLWEQFGPKLTFWATTEKENPYYFQNTVPKINNKISAEKLTEGHGRRTSAGKLVVYRDLRYSVKKTVSIGLTKKQLIDSIEQDHYAPAMLLAGRLTLATRVDFTGTVSKNAASLMAGQKWNTEKALRLALTQFIRGAELGNNECLVEAMHCRLRLGELKLTDFSSKLDVKLADYPLYYMLKYMVKNPKALGVKEFLARRYVEARKIWQANSTPSNDFLLGAETIYQYYHYGFSILAYRLLHEDTQEVKNAFIALDRAAQAGIAPALYICGKQYLEGNRNNQPFQNYGNVGKGIRLLNNAAKAGHLKARYLLVKYEFEKNKLSNKHNRWLHELKPARQAQFADAWYLSSKILKRKLMKNHTLNSKVLTAFRKSGELGAIRAWYDLGMMYYNDRNKKTREESRKKSTECWRKFIKLDNYARSQDYSDFFWPKLRPPKVFYINNNGIRAPASAVPSKPKRKIKRYVDQY